MTDVFTKEKRSYVMSRIRSKNTKIEVAMKQILTKNRVVFVQHPKVFGNPDFLVGARTLIFCDGDFWHGYKYWSKKRLPKKFWRDKIEGNMLRDRRVSSRLRRQGWSVLRLWEHDIQDRPKFCLSKILRSNRATKPGTVLPR